MKKMIIMAAVLLAACECGWAEDGFFSTKKSEEQVSVEFRGGLSVSQMAAVDDGASNKGYRRLGYNASAVIDIPVCFTRLQTCENSRSAQADASVCMSNLLSVSSV